VMGRWGRGRPVRAARTSPRLVEAILQGRPPVELTATSLTELACEHSVLLSPIDFLEIREPFVNRQRQPLLKHQNRRGGTGSPIPWFFPKIWAAL
jgi:hypothetical protein